MPKSPAGPCERFGATYKVGEAAAREWVATRGDQTRWARALNGLFPDNVVAPFVLVGLFRSVFGVSCSCAVTHRLTLMCKSLQLSSKSRSLGGAM